jgi:hypothetical protein
MTERDEEAGKLIPLFGRDEMNLIEFPFGPISSTTAKTLEVEHQVFDKRLKREVTRSLIITGTDKWGLPRPSDDQVLIGLKTLTHESGYVSQKIEFTRYELCRIIGWPTDGRSYVRLEESLDRMKATTLKFKDSWYVNSEKEYKSKTFSIIEDVEICSRDQIERARLKDSEGPQLRCSFRWSEVIWKSFQDGFMKTLDMRMFRRIAEGRRREVPLRLWRILDKRFYNSDVARFKLRRLCEGTLGLSPNYGPAQMLRILDRAAKWLIECEYLEEMWHRDGRGDVEVFFRKYPEKVRRRPENAEVARGRGAGDSANSVLAVDGLKLWLSMQREDELISAESEALEQEFGSDFERTIVQDERASGIPVLEGRLIRKEYIRRYFESQPSAKLAASTRA